MTDSLPCAPAGLALSEIDRQRFGVTVAKAALGPGDDVAAVLAWCKMQSVQLLMARCSTDHIGQAQALEAAGAFLTDTLVYFCRRHVAEAAVVLPEGYRWRLATPADGAQVERLAAHTFEGYFGHYHVDPRLSRGDADLVYSDWAGNSCRSTAVADAVLLIEQADALVAFATIKLRAPGTFEGVLFGVHPKHQGKRLYHSLMQLAQNWGRQAGQQHMIVSTQVNNLAVQKTWCRQGFEPSESYYTFHHWSEARP